MPLITFTSNFGSGGMQIAEKVSKQLGIEYYDDRKLQERALSMGISNIKKERIVEGTPGFFDRLFTNKPALYLDLLGAVVYDVAEKGEGVIVGHGAQFFLKDFNCAFHVMVHAPEATRVQWLAKQQNISEDTGRILVRKMDKRLKEFVQYNFDRDWNDPSGYDLVINLDKIGIGWAIKLITEFAKSDEVKECSMNALEEMELSSLKYQVNAAVMKNNLYSPFAQIIVEIPGRGQVRLSGWTYSSDERRRIVAVAKSVSSVTEVRSDIFVMPSGY
jgi:cytidylate kinase